MTWLENKEYQRISAICPIAAIDVCIFDDRDRLLMAERKNSPAKGYYFVPGGRIRFLEKQESALKRIMNEEGVSKMVPNGKILTFGGIYDHIYDSGPLDSSNNSHYVVAMYWYKLENSVESCLRELIDEKGQHKSGSWKFIERNSDRYRIHNYAHMYFSAVK